MSTTSSCLLAVLLFLCCSLHHSVAAQITVLQPGTERICTGTLLDPGGNRDYANDESIRSTICPITPNSQVALNFTWADIRRGDLLCIYDGTTDTDPQLTCSSRWTGARLLVQATAENASGCLTLVWETDSAEVGRGFEAEISCEAICQTIIPVLATASPPLSSDSIPTFDLCPGDFIDLGAGAEFPQNGIAYHQSISDVTYRWALPDGREHRGQRLQYGFSEPGGYRFELYAKDGNGCSSIQPLQIRVRVAADPVIRIDEALTDAICAPNALELSLLPGGGISGASPVQYFQPITSRTDSLPLPDGTGASHESVIVVSQFAPGETLQSADQLRSICADMEHSWLRDLSIDLISPDGRVAVLHDHPGRFGEEAFLGEPFEGDAGNQTPVPGVAYTYCWNDTDPKGDWLTYLNNNPTLTTLPAGTYRSYDPLSVLVGAPLNGAWTLRIKDHWEADNGWIFTWSIDFADGIPLAIDSFRTEITDAYWLPNQAQSAYSRGEIAYAPTVPGTIESNFLLVNNFGCSYDSSIINTILSAADENCEPCESTVDTLPTQSYLLGDTVFFDLSTIGQAASVYRFAGASNFSFSSHPPSRPLSSKLLVSSAPIQQLGPEGEGLEAICIDIAVEDASDIVARLSTPSGQELTLLQNDAVGRQNISQVCFTPTATQNFTAAGGVAEYAPKDPWSVLGGSQVDGEWTLLLSDASGFLEQSTLYEWSLTFQSDTETTITLPSGIASSETGSYYAIPNTSTFYTISYAVSADCERTLVFPIDIRYPCALDLQRIGFIAPSCSQEADAQVILACTGNQGPVRYTLNGQTNLTGKFVDLVAGTYTAMAEDSVACIDSLTFSLTAPPGLTISYEYTVAACDPVLYDVQVALEGDVDVREAIWLDESSLTVGLRQNILPGDYTFKTIDENGCIVFHPIRLPDIPPLTVIANVQDLGCADDGSGQVQLEVFGGTEGYTILWEDGFDGMQRAGLAAGTYYGEVVDGAGCTTGFAARLTEPDPLFVEPIVEPNYCTGETEGAVAFVITGGTGPYEVRADGGAWQEGILLYGLAPGEHQVEVRDLSRCVWSSEVFIPTLSTLGDSLVIELDDSYPFGDTIPLAAAAGKQGTLQRVLWRYTGVGEFSCDTCANTTFIPETSGNIRLMVEDTLGCRQEAIAQLRVEEAPQVLVPSGFQPDATLTENRKLRVHGRSGTVIERFVVFDRWGTQVYETSNTRTNSQDGWDGTYKGQPAPAGVYLYEVTVRARSGAVRRIRGSTTLLR